MGIECTPPAPVFQPKNLPHGIAPAIYETLVFSPNFSAPADHLRDILNFKKSRESKIFSPYEHLQSDYAGPAENADMPYMMAFSGSNVPGTVHETTRWEGQRYRA